MTETQKKAKELIDKFKPHARYWDCYNDEPLEEDHAKQCAILCVDEILKSNPLEPCDLYGVAEYQKGIDGEVWENWWSDVFDDTFDNVLFWKELLPQPLK